MLRNAPPFAAWCVADPGPTLRQLRPGSAAHRFTLRRVRDTRVQLSSEQLRNGSPGSRILEPDRVSDTGSPMPHTSALLGFALVCLGLVLTPGPNMI